MPEETKEVKLNEKVISQEEFNQVQQALEGQRDVKIIQTGKDEYRTRVQD